jgi:hypothetical protein
LKIASTPPAAVLTIACGPPVLLMPARNHLTAPLVVETTTVEMKDDAHVPSCAVFLNCPLRISFSSITRIIGLGDLASAVQTRHAVGRPEGWVHAGRVDLTIRLPDRRKVFLAGSSTRARDAVKATAAEVGAHSLSAYTIGNAVLV